MQSYFKSQIKNGINVPWGQEIFSKIAELMYDSEPLPRLKVFPVIRVTTPSRNSFHSESRSCYLYHVTGVNWIVPGKPGHMATLLKNC